MSNPKPTKRELMAHIRTLEAQFDDYSIRLINVLATLQNATDDLALIKRLSVELGEHLRKHKESEVRANADRSFDTPQTTQTASSQT